jgi:alpha-D-ribose 1-methylphosphonate 5-triphosphate diphosphatase
MGGPNVVRGGSHSGNVSAAELARHGLLDILSSDYVPGSLLSGVMRLVDEQILTLPQAVAIVSDHPAQATGMNDRGRIENGLRADLIQVRTINMTEGKQHAVVRGVWRQGRQVM